MSFLLTPGNVSDLSVAETLSQGITGKLFGDKGYISSSLTQQLLERGLHLFRTLRRTMKQKLLSWENRVLLRKRALIETVNDQLKNLVQIDHTRHRSVWNFMVNTLSGLIAYMHQDKKPSLRMFARKKALIVPA